MKKLLLLLVLIITPAYADDFTITINDLDQLSWIEQARIDYNKNNPQNQLKDKQAYFEWYISSWFGSNTIQYKSDKLDSAVSKAKTGDVSDLTNIIIELQKK